MAVIRWRTAARGHRSGRTGRRFAVGSDGRKSPKGVTVGDVRSRALAMWPGLDRKKLTRTCGNLIRVARLVERRTALPREAILGMLEVRPSANE